MKVTELLVIGVIATSLGSFATTRSSSVRSSSSRSYSSHTTTSTPKPTATVKPVASKSTTWSSSKTYGTSSSKKTGTAQLKSKTPVPKAHTYSGTTYNSSQAPYTDTSGFWVYYWLSRNNTIQCFDKNHKRVTCDRDNKSYSVDW